MRIFAPLLLTLMLALVFPDRLPARGDTADPSIPPSVAHRVVVKLRPGDGSAIDRGRNLLAPVAAEYGIISIATWLDPRLLQGNRDGMGAKRAADGLAASGLERIITIIYMSDIPPEMMAAKLRSIPGVEYAEPVYPRFVGTIPNDPQISQQSYLDQIRAVQGWGIVNADSSIIIAIVDTGTDPTHPDLAAALWRNPGEIGTDALGRDMRSNGVDDDGDGFRDDWQGYDFGGKDGYTPDNDPSPGYWHGTHVAGIAGAIANNGIGVAGIGFGAKLMIVKIADDNPTSPTLTTGPDGILFAARHGAQVINCSWGGPGYSQAEQDLMDVVTRMGACVIAAAGNEGDGRNSISYPASYRNVLSVGSVQRNDQHSSFSSYNIEVGISAPGDAIYSTVPRQTAQSGYMYSRGTSMSTPIVSGAAALLLTKYRDLPPGQVIAILQSTVDTIDSLNPDYRDVLGTGRLNIERALTVGPAGEAASVLDYKVIESANPGIVEAGETIAFHLRVKNLLSPVTNMRVMLTAASGETPEIEQSIEEFGAMDSYEERESGDGYFRVTIPKAVPTDYKLRLYFVMMDGDRKIGLKIVELMVNPNYGTTAFNKTRVTFTGNGRIGFNDFPSDLQGKGFSFDSSANLLAEGGLIVATGPDRVEDVVRGGTDYALGLGLQTVEPYRVGYVAAENAEVGHARFNDAHLPAARRIGLDITLTTRQYNDSAAASQTLLFYRIRNTSAARLTNLYCALFMDWDLGPAGADDYISIDLAHRVGYADNRKNRRLPYTGTMLLSDQPANFYAIDNSTDYPIGKGFMAAEKWALISGGIGREETKTGDCSMIIGAGPIALEPGADTIVAFSLMAGANIAELNASADAARARFTALGELPGGPILLPSDFTIASSVPNPFNGETVIEYWLPTEGEASLDVFDAIGRRVATLASGFQTKGVHTARFTLPDNAASEVYVVRLAASGMVVSRNLIHLAR